MLFILMIDAANVRVCRLAKEHLRKINLLSWKGEVEGEQNGFRVLNCTPKCAPPISSYRDADIFRALSISLSSDVLTL